MNAVDQISPARLHNFRVFDRVFFGDETTEFCEIVVRRSHIEAKFSVDEEGKVGVMRLRSPIVKITFLEGNVGTSQFPFSVSALELQNNLFVVNPDYVPHPDITDALFDLVSNEELMG